MKDLKTEITENLKQNKKVQNFESQIFQYGVIAAINRPTRVSKNTATKSIFDNNFKSTIIKNDTSDHFPI